MFKTYHGVSGAVHQINYTRLKSKGFRLISLSAYGAFFQTLFAAVWVQRSGPAWEGFHGLSAVDFQTKFERLTAEGYANVLLSVVGNTSANAVFAGTFEKRDNAKGSFMTLIGLPDGADTKPGTFQYWNLIARSKNLTLRCASVYGTLSLPLVAAIWEVNTDKTHWIAKTHETKAEYKSWLDTCTQLQYRPAFVTLSKDYEKYLSIFRDDDVAADWISKQGLSGKQYESEVDNQKRDGRYPICVQGGGPSSAPLYSAIFAKQDIPSPKVLTTKGRMVPELDQIDKVMSTFMKANGVRAGQLTIAKDGIVKFERAYTYAARDYPITQPSDLMRLASVSKAFTCAAMTKALAANLVTSSTLVFPLLEISSPALNTQIPSPFINTITVQHLIDHAGGWKTVESGFDPLFHFRDIAFALQLTTPITKRDIARYMYGEPLQFEPGTQDFDSSSGTSYSNFGYLLLGLVIEKVSNRSYIDFLQERVTTPAGITAVAVGKTRREELRPDEVSYDDPGFGLSAIDPDSDVPTPYPYGGEGFITEAIDSTGGVIATATTVARLIHRYAVWGTGGRAAGLARAGSVAGSSSFAWSRDDGVDLSYIFNTRDFPVLDSQIVLGNLIRNLNATLVATPISS